VYPDHLRGVHPDPEQPARDQPLQHPTSHPGKTPTRTAGVWRPKPQEQIRALRQAFEDMKREMAKIVEAKTEAVPLLKYFAEHAKAEIEPHEEEFRSQETNGGMGRRKDGRRGNEKEDEH
jgi:hypothetical protein